MLLHQLLADKQLILASNSPRRKQLLAGLDVNYQIWTNNDNPETYPNDLPIEQIPVYLAKQKATPFLTRLTNNVIIITSDTIVCCDNKVLGKPSDANQAKQMLSQLSGTGHTVITGVAITSLQKQAAFDARTKVYFKSMSTDEIDYYVDKYQPLDKAGAYGIQEWIGYIGIERIEGSYFNVMGLPVQKLYGELCRFVQSEHQQ